MKLQNTINVQNQFAAQGINHVAIYQDGAVSTYQKNKPFAKMELTGPTYSIMGVRQIRISPSGEYIAVQTKTKTVRLHNGVQENFDNNVGAFSIADTGQIVMIALASGAVQVIDSSVTNLTVAVTDDDRVVCAKGRYMVYNRARTIISTYDNLVLSPVASAKEIVWATHDHNGKFVVFYSDGTYSFDGAAAKALAIPNLLGFRDAGDQILATDKKKDWCVNHFRPLAFPEQVRAFKWTLPSTTNTDFEDLLLMAPGSGISSADFDLKNGLAIANNTAVTSVADAPYGAAGKSWLFNGTTSTLQTADSANIQLGANDFTLEMFVKVDPATSAVATVVQKGGGLNVSWSSFLIQALTASKTFTFAATFNNTQIDVGTSDGNGWGSFEFNVWTHIAITRKGNKWRCFQDGKLRVTYTASGTVYANASRGIQFGHSRQNNFNTGALYGRFKGNINGFQILNYAKYTHDFYPDTISTTADIPRAKGDSTVAFEVPATMGSSLTTNDTNKQITSVNPLKYVDQSGTVVTLPAQTFDGGSILRPITEDVIAADRSYSGSYFLSFNGGQSWVGYSPAGALGGGQGRAVLFKDVMYVLHGTTTSNSTIRKFTNLPNQTSNDIVVGLPYLFGIGTASNENALVTTSSLSTATRIYITWDGTAFYDYPLAPIVNANASVDYVGNNVFVITEQTGNIRHFYYVPTTPGAPQLLGTIAKTYLRVMQFTNKIVVYKSGQLLSKPYPKRVDGYNATQAEAQAYVDFILTIPTDGAANTTLAGSAITPLYKQNRISIGNGNTSQIWNV